MRIKSPLANTSRVIFAIAALVAASAVVPPAAIGQPSVGTATKIDHRLRERAASEAVIPVLVVLARQPQYEMMRQAEGTNALRRQIAESRPNGKSREAAEAVVLETRREAFQAIERAIGPEQDALEARLKGLGASAVSRYLGINMLAAELPASALAALEADPAVAHVFAVEKDAPQLATSVPALGAPAFWNAGFAGQGESVGILDTGVRTNHPAFAGVEVVSRVFLAYGVTDACFADSSSSAEDQLGHGTHVAGIVASQGPGGWTNYQGVAKGIATLYNLKVSYKVTPSTSCGSYGKSDQRDMLAALDWAVRNTPLKIFNYSWGIGATGDDDGFSQAVDQYIDTYGLTITLAAGNGGPANYPVISPAIAYNGIAVGNWASRGVMNAGSSLGPTAWGRLKPDLAAPGTNVFSAAFNWDATPGTADDLASGTGTSMAAPHIAGAAALLRSAGVEDPLAIKAILINSTDNPGWAADSGWGFTNLERAESQLYYDTGSLAVGGFQLYRVTPSPDFRATVAWNRHMVGGASYVNHLYPCAIDNIARFFCYSQRANVVQLSGTDYATGLVGVAVDPPFAPLAGVSSEPYAIAFNTPFARLSGPQLGVSCSVPAPVPSGSLFSVTCSVTNSGDLATRVEGQLTLPVGFSAVTGGMNGTPFVDLAPASAGTLTIDGIAATNLPGTYRFGVNVSEGSHFNASASSSFVVTVAAGDPPLTLTAPANGATGVSQAPALTWGPAAGAPTYTVYLWNAANPLTSTSQPVASNITATSFTPSALTAGTLYYWQVVARSATTVNYSAIWTFRTQASSSAPQYLITTVAGVGKNPQNGNEGFGGDGGPATAAYLYVPTGVVEDPAGNLYVSDTGNERIRKVTPDGFIQTIAGTGTLGFTGEGGPAISAQLGSPTGLAMDAAGSLYVAEPGNKLIRKVTPDGLIRTVAGQNFASCTSRGDGGLATLAWLCNPNGVALDAAGEMFITDRGNGSVRKVSTSGIISTLGSGFADAWGLAADAAGDVFTANDHGVFKIAADGALTAVAQLSCSAVAVDSSGDLHVACSAGGNGSRRIVKIAPDGTETIIAGNTSAPSLFWGDGGIATQAAFYFPEGMAIGAAGTILVADTYNDRVRVLAPLDPSCRFQLDRTSVAVSATGGVLPISVQTGPGCGWVVTGLPSWLGAKTYGVGPGTVNLTAVPNPGILQSATISIAGYAVRVMLTRLSQFRPVFPVQPALSLLPAIRESQNRCGEDLPSSTSDLFLAFCCFHVLAPHQPQEGRQGSPLL